MKTLTITQPDDWHIHLRDGQALAHTVAAVSEHFARAIVMPNLAPPVTNVIMALDYYQRIKNINPNFEPLMTLYLTDDTTEQDIVQAASAKQVQAIKLYPAGATTNSAYGVSDINKRYRILEAMQTYNVPLLVHAEVVEDTVDIFDREAVFIERYLNDIVKQFPQLRVVVEHITTKDAVDFVSAQQTGQVAATITPQHLLFNRNHLLVGGIKPHFYCLPVLKRNSHQQALITAAVSGSPQFFLGSDSAPHVKSQKESACGCAGCYSANHTLQLYSMAFEQAGALDKLEGFTSFYGADFYQLSRNTKKIQLTQHPYIVKDSMPLGSSSVVPLLAGCDLGWSVVT